MKVLISNNGCFNFNNDHIKWFVDNKNWVIMDDLDDPETDNLYIPYLDSIYYNICYTNEFRTHPDIYLNVLKHLGVLGEGLKIVEIPDGVKFYIFGHDDGSEIINERHRTWS